MTISVMSRVWADSKASESSLLVMLALADRADEEGVCWPGLEWIGKKARIKDERHIRRILRRQEDAGELYVSTGQGRGKTSLYLVCIGLEEEELSRILVKRFEMPVSEAISTAKAIVAKRGVPARTEAAYAVEPKEEKGGLHAQKGVQEPPFASQEKGGCTREKGVSAREKGVQTPPDPLMIRHDPSVTDATRATPPTAPAQLSAPAVSEADYQTVVKAYQNEIGLLTPIISDAIKDQLRQCPATWLTLAIGIAVKRNNRRWSYVEGILHRWQVEGFDGGPDNLSGTLSGGAERRNRNTGSKSAGYARQVRGGQSPRKGRQDNAPINITDPDMAEFLATFVDARDGSRAIAAD